MNVRTVLEKAYLRITLVRFSLFWQFALLEVAIHAQERRALFGWHYTSHEGLMFDLFFLQKTFIPIDRGTLILSFTHDGLMRTDDFNLIQH